MVACRRIMHLLIMFQLRQLVRPVTSAITPSSIEAATTQQKLKLSGSIIRWSSSILYGNAPKQITRLQLGFCSALSPSLIWQSSVPSKRPISSSFVCHQKPNRYERFRVCIRSKQNDNINEVSSHDLLHVAKTTMEMLSSGRRSFNRTWSRMSPLLELIISASLQNCGNKHSMIPFKQQLRSIADVGCDHGLLSLSLASIAWTVSQSSRDGTEISNNSYPFLSKVIGSDLSSNALNAGGIHSLDKIYASLSRKSNENIEGEESQDSLIKIPVEFRIGSGLSTLQQGDADGVVLAGMGVNTMLEILFENDGLDRLGTNFLFLQPTNSRPRNLILLYDALQNGKQKWVLLDENIVFLDGRWYINSYFKKQHDNSSESKPIQFQLPGDLLKNKNVATYKSYMTHHIQWLERDYGIKARLDTNDERWMHHICSDKNYTYLAETSKWYHSNAHQ